MRSGHRSPRTRRGVAIPEDVYKRQLYLWHWPVLTLVAERRGTGSLPVSESLLWLLVSLGLSIATYRLVENPIRRSPSLIGRRWASVVLGGCLILASLTVATAEIHLHRVPGLATDLTGLQTSAACPSPTAQELIPLMGTDVYKRQTQHGSCWRSSTSSSLTFQDTPRPDVPLHG